MSFIVKTTTLIGPLGLIAPHSCRGCGQLGRPLCDRCKKYILNLRSNFCPLCKLPTKNGLCHHCKDLPPIFVVGEKVGLLETAIHDLKYHSTRAMSPILAELLNDILPDTSQAIIVPLPTSTRHVRARGLDHTLLIAKHLAKLRHERVSKVLLRAQNTTQVGASRLDRLSQAKSAYQINPKISIDQNTTYLLIDDVWTTGASMQSGIKKLRDAGAKRIVVGLLAVSRLD